MRLVAPRLCPPLRARPGRRQGRGTAGRPGVGLARARAWPAACAVLWLGCHGAPLPAAPGEPIPAPPEVALDTMDAECDALLAALAAYKKCPNLEDDDRTDLDAWIERTQQDFAAGKKVHPEPSAQHAIAAACHKAVGSVVAANERCHNGKKPRP